MADEPILTHIGALVDEEHQLLAREGADAAPPRSARTRL
jgi:hypothetical protein